MKYVALAVDENPSYAVYAPIVTRLWRRIGYEPMLLLHLSDWWKQGVGEYIARHLSCRIEYVSAVPPLDSANTMRVARLAVAALMHRGAFVLTSDIDMAPLHREWFQRVDGPVTVLRATSHGGWQGQTRLEPARFRLPLCYVGMHAAAWWEVCDLVPGNLSASLKSVASRAMRNQPDYDEEQVSVRLLSSRFAEGNLEQVDATTWRQGEIFLRPMDEWPNGGYKGMLVRGDWRVAPIDEPHIDFHMPHPPVRWVGKMLKRYWNEESDFLDDYWTGICSLLGAHEE